MKIAYLRFFGYMFNRQVERYGLFANNLELQLEADARELKDELYALPDPSDFVAAAPYLDRIFIAEEFSIEHLRTANVVALYSYFEVRMVALMDLVQEALELEPKVGNKSGDGAATAMEFLKDRVGVNVGELNDKWSKVSEIQKIRHLIVHCHCNAEKARSPDTIRQFVKKNDCLSLDKNNFVRPDAHYFSWASESLSNFYIELVNMTHEMCLIRLEENLSRR